MTTADVGKRLGWFTVKEYADFKGVDPETVRRWIRKKLIDAERTGERGWYRIKRDEQAA